MRESEIEVKNEFEDKGYTTIRDGHPDFVFYKENDGVISDITFVEVKSGSNTLSKEQERYKRVLKSLGLNYQLIRKSSPSLHCETKTIKVSEEVLKEIEDSRKYLRETYSDILERLLKLNMPREASK